MSYITKARITFCVATILLGIIFSMSIISSLGSTPVSMSKDTSLKMSSIMPQGWGFFSKNPRDEQLGLYPIDNASSEITWPNMAAGNAFGLYRKGRSQGVELGGVSTELKESDWIKCDEDLESCKRDADKKTVTVQNAAPSPLVCGEYYITKENPVPWNYSKYDTERTKLTNIVRVNITCTKK